MPSRGPIRCNAPRLLQAVTAADTAISIDRVLEARSEKPELYRRNLLSAYFKRSLIHYDLDDMARTLADLEAAGAIGERLRQRDPDDQEIASNLNAIHEQQAMTLAHLGRAAEALRLGRQSFARKQRLLAQAPGDPGRTRELANGAFMLASVHAELGDTVAACRYFVASRAQYTALEQRQPLSEYDRGEVVALDQKLKGCG